MVWKDLEGNVTDIGQGVTCLPLHISSWNQKLIFKQISRIWTRYLTINIFQNESSYFSTSPAMLLSQTHCVTDRSLIVPGLKHSALYTFPPPSMLLAFPAFSTSSEETCLIRSFQEDRITDTDKISFPSTDFLHSSRDIIRWSAEEDLDHFLSLLGSLATKSGKN